jgi:hypothetical protein
MAYGLGRRVEYYDGPTIRRIVRDAKPGGYRFADFVLGIVSSDAFRSRRVPVPAAAADEDEKGAPNADAKVDDVTRTASSRQP